MTVSVGRFLLFFTWKILGLRGAPRSEGLHSSLYVVPRFPSILKSKELFKENNIKKENGVTEV